MGRKKKKPKDTPGKGSPGAENIIIIKEGESPEKSHSWLELKLVVSSSLTNQKNATRDVGKRPIVNISEFDCQRIAVLNDDGVFLLIRQNGRKDITSTAVCSVRVIAANGGGGTPRRSATASPRGSTKSIRLSRGHCQVSPSSFLSHFMTNGGATMDDRQTEDKKQPPTPSPTKSTTAEFSFARGGGGDVMISPDRQSSTTSSPLPTIFSSTADCIVVPFDSDLGSQVAKILCSDAEHIQLEILSDFISESTWSKSHQIIERLVIATNKDRFVRAGETIRSSFQGKSVELRVLSVAGASNKKGVSRLMEDLSDLKISRDDKTKDTPFVVDLRTALCRKPDKLALFRITTATRVSTQLTGYILPEQQDIPEHNRLVAGLDSTIERLKDLLLPALLRPELFLEGSLKPPRGALLYGPSGTGKSLLAKQLGMDISRNVRVEFVNCTTLQSHTALVGEAERKLTQLFRRLQNQPSEGPTNVLLILDDVHLICPKRDGRNPGVDRLAATLLALLDGIGSTTTDRAESSGNLVVLAITTNPSLLDPALRRPGRLDAEVEVPIPDELTRAAILKFQLDAFRQDADVPELDDSEVLALSRLAKGFNGADCMLAIKEAIRCSVAQSPASTKANPKVMLEDLQSAIRSTKPSSITSITVEIPQVHWSSIGGMDSVKQQLREAIELPITHAHLFEALSIPPPRGVLLYGPPGCSKTLMARALATEGQMNFLAVKGPELLSKWLGESERALASLFRRARMASPCIIFFDEIDAIAAKRGGSDGNAGGERLLSQLLTELDGVRNTTGKSGSVDKERIVVVGATNRPDLLDSALMRPGRMDRKIYVGLPDEQSRRRIFEIGLKDKACSDDVVVSELAKDDISHGFSGAEIIGICREAALFAIEEVDELQSGDQDSNVGRLPQIGMRHLLKAIQGMQRQITEEMLQFYASYNESKALR